MSGKLGMEGFDLKAYDEEPEKSRNEEQDSAEQSDGSIDDDNTTEAQKVVQGEVFTELEHRAEEATLWLNDIDR